ncbi:hypothetical protein [Phreatobacter sp. AB_2022a]|uniref:hypothetical protein n=1 Tax=Phreatobacter sp. AB_2022a TaxID=3003134 RepID=UPI002287366F|nr:hypothetical protein [Phreatobacter sp. AB_2022a]MCZ0738081.1 hypothetical protein [Phreatobacter sp. AB_2022a]
MDRAAEKPCLDLVRDLANDRRRALNDADGRRKFTPDFNRLDAFERCRARFCGEHRGAPAHDLGYPESSLAKDVRDRLDRACEDGARGRLALIVFFFGEDRARDCAQRSTSTFARRTRDVDVDVEDDRRARRAIVTTTMRSVSRATRRATIAQHHEKRRARRAHDTDPHRDDVRRARRATDHSGLRRTTRAMHDAAC